MNTLFSSYEFTFAGESCYQYGLMLYDFGGNGQSDVAFGNKAQIIESRSNNRIQPIHFGVNYHEEPLQFKLVFGAEDPLDRYQLEDIAAWLTGYQDYQWLTIEQPDLAHVQFRCLITSLTPLTYGWLPVAFEATVTCDCPYAYGQPFEETYSIDGETSILFRNNSSVREYLRPQLIFVPSGEAGSLSIINEDDGRREFLLDGLTGSMRVTVDNQSGVIQETNHGDNLYDGFNMNFLRLVRGDNHLVVTGSGTLTISGRTLHNVAG